MSYEFKVGDEGETTTGYVYRIIATDLYCGGGKICIVAIIKSAVDCVYEYLKIYDQNGLFRYDPDSGVLLPPTKIVYVNLLRRRKDYFFTYDTAEEAVEAAEDDIQYYLAIAAPVEILK